MHDVICENKIYCKDFTDVQIYPCYKSANLRGKKIKASSEVQQRLNENNSKKRLMRLIHANFTNKDYALHLTYNDENYPLSVEQAKRDIQNYMRRLKRYYKKNGNDKLKYIWVMETGKKTARMHFHLILSGGADRTEIEKLWGKGYANSKALIFSSKGVAGLSHYISKQGLLYRFWSCSKNLKQPIEKKNYSVFSYSMAKKLYEAAQEGNVQDFKKAYPRYKKIFKDYDISEVEAVRNSEYGGYYFTLRMFRVDSKYIDFIE